ncbi:early nodulin-like protein 2 [Portunus trituberculatus]|uniref:early nodulin-like protein 2 n=1 Tax=Portunus trituberculatus TaxID=210409 RepID=UPI001E1CC200|nr:early nodulin-like protein 2 [Portunus trituberculatus]
MNEHRLNQRRRLSWSGAARRSALRRLGSGYDGVEGRHHFPPPALPPTCLPPPAQAVPFTTHQPLSPVTCIHQPNHLPPSPSRATSPPSSLHQPMHTISLSPAHTPVSYHPKSLSSPHHTKQTRLPPNQPTSSSSISPNHLFPPAHTNPPSNPHHLPPPSASPRALPSTAADGLHFLVVLLLSGKISGSVLGQRSLSVSTLPPHPPTLTSSLSPTLTPASLPSYTIT